MVKISFWIMVFILFYIYIGYYLFLKILSILTGNGHKARPFIAEENLPSVSIIITVYNEEDVIAERIENLFALDYPEDKIEIIIGSDGSTDNTVALVRKYCDGKIRLFEFEHNRGRACVHNDVAKEALGDILIFTDADSSFETDFIQKIVRNFSDQSVGCSVGNLIYRTEKTSIAESEGMYWRYEKRIRQIESNLGIFATATGACTAVRKRLWKEIGPTDDIDFITPLDVIKQGYKVIFDSTTNAYDRPVSSVTGELKVRIRQTSKNLSGTLRHWDLSSIMEHPAVSLGLFSHKILRWFTPFFLIAVFMANLALINESGIYSLIFWGQLVFYGLALIGFAADRMGRRLPFASSICSFCAACLGMGIGIIWAMIGKVPRSWQSAT